MAHVVRAESAGFCMGVSRALHLLHKEETRTQHQLGTLGPIIHNTQVLQSLEAKGIEIYSAEDVIDTAEERTVLIRAHGIPRQIEDVLCAKPNITVIDATCPKVKDAQLAIYEASQEGYVILLYGEKEHAEVRGLCSYADEIYVFSSLQGVQEHTYDRTKKYALVSQTTQNITEFTTIYTWLKEHVAQDIRCINTICDATYIRQNDILSLVDKVEAMVIVGGYTSGNTKRLAEIAQEAGLFTVHIEEVSELPLDSLKQYQSIGLSAGASTPKEYIDAVEDALRAL
ncbi:MAG: 4-hydroxy-3-methylbut-2-enyl diphosphate reductase [Desulfovibrionaceae bacterium]|nr:4-hydroxy-3-methylbut-2-enyl diphosphate reductase [Desulfovibrionaceae bacterium]